MAHEGAGSFVSPIDVLHVATPNRLHQTAEPIGMIGRYQQVDMVGHEHVGMNGAVVIGGGFL